MLVHVLLDLRWITFCKHSAVVVFFSCPLANNNMGAAVPSSAVQADTGRVSQF